MLTRFESVAVGLGLAALLWLIGVNQLVVVRLPDDSGYSIPERLVDRVQRLVPHARTVLLVGPKACPCRRRVIQYIERARSPGETALILPLEVAVPVPEGVRSLVVELSATAHLYGEWPGPGVDVLITELDTVDPEITTSLEAERFQKRISGVFILVSPDPG